MCGEGEQMEMEVEVEVGWGQRRKEEQNDKFVPNTLRQLSYSTILCLNGDPSVL